MTSSKNFRILPSAIFWAICSGLPEALASSTASAWRLAFTSAGTPCSSTAIGGGDEATMCWQMPVPVSASMEPVKAISAPFLPSWCT